MGKTRRTYRDKLGEFEADIEGYRRALRGDEIQQAFDDVMRAPRDQSMAGNAANTVDPMTTIWLSIAVAQQEQINELEARLSFLEGEK